MCRKTVENELAAPLRTPSHPEHGILGRLCAPVRFAGCLTGFLFLIDDGQRLGPAEMSMVIEAERQAALLIREEELAERLSASVLDHLISPSAELREAAARHVSEQGLTEIRAPHPIVCLRPADVTLPGLPAALGEAMADLGRQRRPLALLRAARQDHALVLVRVASVDDDRAARLVADEGRKILARRLRAGSPRGHPVRTRVISGIGEPCPRLTEAAESYRQAMLAAKVVVAVPSLGTMGRWHDLGAFRALAQLPTTQDGASCLDSRLQLLLDSPGDLAETVECYLDLGGDTKRAADQLHLHRTTLYYRLRRAQELTGADLRDGYDRLALHLSFKLARLIGTYPVTTVTTR